MNVFVSYSAASKEWAVRLKSALQHHGVNTWSDPGDTATQLSWSERIEQAIRNAQAIVILLEGDAEPDDKQRLTWQLTIEAVWSDDHKRLIPFLLRNAELPSFARAAVPPDGSLPVVRVHDPYRDWERAVNNLIALLHGQADPQELEQVPAVTEQDREEHQQRRAQIAAYVDTLKARMDLPDNPAGWKAHRRAQ
jgi:hypothetical protein